MLVRWSAISLWMYRSGGCDRLLYCVIDCFFQSTLSHVCSMYGNWWLRFLSLALYHFHRPKLALWYGHSVQFFFVNKCCKCENVYIFFAYGSFFMLLYIFCKLLITFCTKDYFCYHTSVYSYHSCIALLYYSLTSSFCASTVVNSHSIFQIAVLIKCHWYIVYFFFCFVEFNG